LEADTAIRTLPEENQAYVRQLVANNIQKLISKQNQNRNKTKHTEREYAKWRIIKNIKHKLISNQSIITKPDKDNKIN
jgi:hypothetical protein